MTAPIPSLGPSSSTIGSTFGQPMPLVVETPPHGDGGSDEEQDWFEVMKLRTTLGLFDMVKQTLTLNPNSENLKLSYPLKTTSTAQFFLSL